MNRPPLDWQDVAVQRERVMRDLSNLPWAPREVGPFFTLRGAFVTLVLVCAVFGLFVVGGR